MVISCLYVQTVIRQCFCFPNSQWGATAHDNCKTQIFLGNSPGYHLINLIYLIDCFILPMSLQGLFGCRNFMVSIETEWQATLCFAHGCFHNLGLHFYFTQSSNANSLSGLNPFKLIPNTWKTTFTFAIDTLCSQCDYS